MTQAGREEENPDFHSTNRFLVTEILIIKLKILKIRISHCDPSFPGNNTKLSSTVNVDPTRVKILILTIMCKLKNAVIMCSLLYKEGV